MMLMTISIYMSIRMSSCHAIVIPYRSIFLTKIIFVFLGLHSDHRGPLFWIFRRTIVRTFCTNINGMFVIFYFMAKVYVIFLQITHITTRDKRNIQVTDSSDAGTTRQDKRRKRETKEKEVGTERNSNISS